MQNYGPVLDATLCFDDLTALIGANGVGKSALLKAISLFYDPTPRVTERDCHCQNNSDPITLTATFTGLSEQARDRFGPYIQGNTLVIERVIRIKDGNVDASYHGSRLRCSDFRDFWSQKSATPANAEYVKIRQKKEYKEFPALRSHEERKAHLEQWEIDHPEQCTRVQDEERFFGFKEVGRGYLGHFTKFLLVEAVHDASSDEREARGSALGDIMQMAVRADFDTSGLQEIKAEMGERVRDYMSREKIEDRLSGLGDELTRALRTYVSDGQIELELERMPEVSLELPKAAARLVEDAYKTDVQGAGHGLQRAFIMAVLSYLASAGRRPASEGAEAQPAPGLVLCIEEPELYQHPNRQRHMAEALLRLSKKCDEASGRTQIVYATHSPHFVGIDRIDQLRLVKKAAGSGGRHTVVSQTSLGRIAEELEAKTGGRRKPSGAFTAATLAARLQAIMTPWMNEGFFSGAVVLVEGEADRAVITGYLSATGSRADSMDISVIPCGGKASIDRPMLIFQHLGIPTYAIWDCDKRKKKAGRGDAANRALLSLFGREYTEPCRLVEGEFACFEDNMTDTIRREFGSPFDETLSKNASDLGFDTDRALKNAHVVAKTISHLKAGGHRSGTLEEIMENIARLPPRPDARSGSGGRRGR